MFNVNHFQIFKITGDFYDTEKLQQKKTPRKNRNVFLNILRQKN